MPIELCNVKFTYMKKTAFECTALNDVSLKIEDGSFTAIAGHTGSGKSTLVQLLNGILQPSSGKVSVDGIDLGGKGDAVLAAKRKVGIVFQYPEHQLFEETVEQDIAFGPKNMQLSQTEIDKRVKEAMEFVCLDYESFRKRSPFQLSGGQKRRAAIAGVIALKPRYLILDEPTAGLDPRGREELLHRIVSLHRQEKLTTIFVSHNMDDIARFADRVIVLEKGKVLLDEEPERAFFHTEEINRAGLAVPQLVNLLQQLKAAGLEIDPAQFTLDDGVNAIYKALKRRKKC